MFIPIAFSPISRVKYTKDNIGIYRINSKKLAWTLDGRSWGEITFDGKAWKAIPSGNKNNKTDVTHIINDEVSLKQLLVNTFHFQQIIIVIKLPDTDLNHSTLKLQSQTGIQPMNLENLDKYIEATNAYLGLHKEKYCGRYIAICLNRFGVEFLFEQLNGNDHELMECQDFLYDNPLFPFANGKTPTEALVNLDLKLGVLYSFHAQSDSTKVTALKNFELKAEHDIDEGDKQTYYEVDWNGIVSDLDSPSKGFYSSAKEKANNRVNRDLFALLNFKYDGVFAQLSERKHIPYTFPQPLEASNFLDNPFFGHMKIIKLKFAITSDAIIICIQFIDFRSSNASSRN